MKMLVDIKIMAIELNEMLNDPVRVKQLTNEYTNLRRYVEKNWRILDQKRQDDQLLEIEEMFLLPALDDIYLHLLNNLKGNAKPNNKMKQIVREIPDRVDYWLEQMK